ncbi:MAG: hypothetical protein ACYTEK_22145, partial [Planctomycetota bacterium]
MSRPVAVVMQSFHVEVGREPFFFTEHDRLQPVGTNADGNIVFLHDLESLNDIVLFLLIIPGV